MTAEFLEFSKAAGNDLSTPRPEWGFEGVEARGSLVPLCRAMAARPIDAGAVAPGRARGDPSPERSTSFRSSGCGPAPIDALNRPAPVGLRSGEEADDVVTAAGHPARVRRTEPALAGVSR